MKQNYFLCYYYYSVFTFLCLRKTGFRDGDWNPGVDVLTKNQSFIWRAFEVYKNKVTNCIMANINWPWRWPFFKRNNRTLILYKFYTCRRNLRILHSVPNNWIFDVSIHTELILLVVRSAVTLDVSIITTSLNGIRDLSVVWPTPLACRLILHIVTLEISLPLLCSFITEDIQKPPGK